MSPVISECLKICAIHPFGILDEDIGFDIVGVHFIHRDAGHSGAVARAGLRTSLLAGALATAETRHGQGSCQGSALRRFGRVAPYLAVHTGMVPHHFCAFVEGLFGPLHAEFERTPKTASVTTDLATTASALSPAAAPTPLPSPPPRPKPSRHAYHATEAVFVAAQLSWLACFAAQGVWLATVGAAWVVACVVGLRVTPHVQAWITRLQNQGAPA